MKFMPDNISSDEILEEVDRDEIEYDTGRNPYELVTEFDNGIEEGLASSNAEATDALGRAFGDASSINEGNKTTTPFSPTGLQVIGMPFFYSPKDDPNNRTFANTFESDLPLVFILPGKPRINQKLFGTADEGGWFNVGSAFNQVGNAFANVIGGAITKKTSWRDSRWMSFNPAVEQYQAFLSVLLNNTKGAMGLIGGTSIIEKIFGGARTMTEPSTPAHEIGFAFYATRSTDISEAANNEYSISDVGREANDKQASIRERKMLASIGGGSLADKAASWIQDLTRQVADLPVVGGLVGALTENLDGAQLYYPDIWGNSTFDRTYSIEFKFNSPYGDARSIFNNVYTPFLMILAMVLPQQDSYYSYTQPFILRINAPGHFECDMGIVRSMTIERGGDGLWSAEHLPREINVRLTVSDMYPNMILPPNHDKMKYNYGLMSYIDALAGIRYDQLATISGFSEGRIAYDIGSDRSSSLLAFTASGNYKDIYNSFFFN